MTCTLSADILRTMNGWLLGGFYFCLSLLDSRLYALARRRLQIMAKGDLNYGHYYRVLLRMESQSRYYLPGGGIVAYLRYGRLVE